jgi:hypothetical protein
MMPSTTRGEGFGDVPLPEVLGGLHRSSVTGVLRVVGMSATRELIMVGGELRAARSSVEQEKLGSWLVGRGVISNQDKAEGLSAQEGSDGPPLGHLLVTRRLISEAVLEAELQGLALSILERATVDERRRAEFVSGDHGQQLDTLPGIATPQLILCSARSLDDAVIKRSVLTSNGSIVYATEPIDAIVQAYHLEMAESILVGKLHRERSLEALRSIAMLSEPQFDGALYALKSAGIVGMRSPRETPGVPVAPSSETPRSPDEITAHEISTPPDEERAVVTDLAARVGRLSHYQVLGVARDATYRQIFDAWDDYERRYHPRRTSEAHLSDLGDSLRRLHEKGMDAFETLSSPERRPRYDMILGSRVAAGEPDMPAVLTRPDATVAGTESPAGRQIARAEELARQGELVEAIRAYERACRLEPRPETLLRLGQLMLAHPRWANRALEQMRRAVEIDPRFVDGWLEVADFWRRRGSAERQRKALERALASDPGHRSAAEQYRALVGQQGLQLFLARVRSRS